MAEKKTVLVISNAAASQMYLGVLMKRMWHFPILARTAMDGIRICENNKIDLTLLDGCLHESETLTAARLLRKTEPACGLPLVVVLAHENQSLSQTLLAEGCSAVLTKPIDFSLTYGLLNRLIDQFRTTPRVPLKARVEIEERMPEQYVTSVNISEGGIYLRTLDPLVEGVMIHLAFSLPHDDETVRLAAEVVRTFPLEDRVENEPGMGLRFLDVPDEVRLKIRNFIQWEMMGDLEWESEPENA